MIVGSFCPYYPCCVYNKSNNLCRIFFCTRQFVSSKRVSTKLITLYYSCFFSLYVCDPCSNPWWPPKKIIEGEGEQSCWTEAEMSAVVVVHQNIEHIVVSTTSRAGTHLGSTSDVSCCCGPTSEFCMQHRVQQSLKKSEIHPSNSKIWLPKEKKGDYPSFSLGWSKRATTTADVQFWKEWQQKKRKEKVNDAQTHYKHSVAKGQLSWWLPFHR